jgi:hypothetical protein
LMLDRWRRAREERIAESRSSSEETERLARAMETLKREALTIGSWAQQRYEENHLTEMFRAGRRR